MTDFLRMQKRDNILCDWRLILLFLLCDSCSCEVCGVVDLQAKAENGGRNESK